jgi:membrane dipeptidase
VERSPTTRVGWRFESAPAELDTIADLPKLSAALARRGFTADDVARVMGGNWLRLLRANLG